MSEAPNSESNTSNMPPPGFYMFLFLGTIAVKVLLEVFVISVKLKTFITPIFALLMLGYQIGLVMSVSNNNCGKINLKDVILYGVVYCILIFGITYALITVFPGWKQAFSNFFGYGVVIVLGIKQLLNKMMKENTTTSDDKLNSIIQKIYDDHSLLVNSLTPDNFNSAIKGLKGIFKPNIISAIGQIGTDFNEIEDDSNTKEGVKLLNKFAHLVMLKDKIAENIWFLVSGGLSLTYASMLTNSSKCELSEEEVNNKVKKFNNSNK